MYYDKLKEIRLERGYTQQDIADVLKINRSTYKDYELHTSIIPIKHLITISDYYGVSLDYMFGFSDILKYDNSRENVSKVEAGNRLKKFRKENKLTQVRLAGILNTTFSSIAFNEKGRNLIATPFLYTICKKYGVSADYLLGKID